MSLPPMADEEPIASDAQDDGASSSSERLSSFGDAMRAGRPSCPPMQRSLEGASLVGGRIQVGRRIGGGGMGTVYEATDNGRTIAIKVLNDVQEFQAYRLKTEFRTLCELIHPNVLCVHELFREGADWFFSMELVDGIPVHRYLEAQRLLADDDTAYEAELRGILRQLVEGIHCIHSAGLVHRDLKPTNVLVSNEGRLVILDFGLVSEQLLGGVGQTIDNRVSGTFGYMSPEQLRGGPASPASDWYAFGALMHQLLSGQPPRLTGGLVPGVPVLSPPSTFDESVPADLDTLCMRLLAPDPKARPSGEELLALTRGFVPPRPSATGTVRFEAPSQEYFVGRDRELWMLRAAFAEARQGQSPVVVLHGPGGTGKTLMLHHFLEELTAHAVLTLKSRCSEWESVPYNGFDGIIDGFSRLLLKMPNERAAHLVPRHVDAVVRLFPALLRVEAFRVAADGALKEPEPENATRRRAVTGLKDVFFRLGERHQVVVAIDDLQWADADTLQLFADLCSPPDTPNLLLVLAVRTLDGYPDRLLEQLGRAAKVLPIALGPLAPEESRSLAAKIFARHGVEDAAESVARVTAEAGGIPLYVSELARKLAACPAGLELTSLRQMLLASIEGLSSASRNLLELVAVSFRPMTVHLANECGVTEAQSSLRQLITQRLVRSEPLPGHEQGFEPYMDQVRQVVLNAMPDARVAALHGVLARALERAPGVEPQWLLSHYRAAGDHERAKRYSIAMAERALSVLAFDHAASMYLSALELTRESSPDWIALNLSCADALTKAGRGADAARAYLRAGRRAAPEQAVQFSNLAVAQWIRSGHLEEGVELLKRSLSAAGVSWPESSAAALARLVYRRIGIRLSSLHVPPRPESEVPRELLAKLDALGPAQTALGTFDYLRGAVFAAEALPLALRAREPKRLVLSLATEAIYGAMLRGTAGATRAHEVHSELEAVRRAGTGNYEYGVSRMVIAMTAYWFGRWRDVVGPASEAETVFRQHVTGALWEANLTRSVRHTVQIHAGQFLDLAREIPEELAAASARDDQYTYLDLLRRSIALHLANDDVAQARSALATLARLRSRYAFLALDHLIMSATVAVHLYTGDARAARAELDARWRDCQRAGMDRLPLVRLSVLGMQADCLAASSVPASEAARGLRQLATSAAEKLAWAPALKSALLGRALEYEGESTLAVRELESAADAFDAAGLKVAAMVARMRARVISEDESLRHGEAAPSSAERALAIAARRAREGRELQPEAALAELGVARPERWARIVHTLY